MVTEKLYMYIFSIFLSDQVTQTTWNISSQKAYFLLEVFIVALFSEGTEYFFRIQCLVTIENLQGILAHVFSPCKSSSHLSGCTCLQGFMRNVEVTFFLPVNAGGKLV